MDQIWGHLGGGGGDRVLETEGMRNGDVLNQKTLGHVCVPVLQLLVDDIDEREHLGSRDPVLLAVNRAGNLHRDAGDRAPPVEHAGDMAGDAGVGRARVRLPDVVFMSLMDDPSNGGLLGRVALEMLHQGYGRRPGTVSLYESRKTRVGKHTKPC